MRRLRAGQALLGCVAAAVLLAGCASAEASNSPDWSPSPNNPQVEPTPGIEISPIVPVPSPSTGTATPGHSGSPGGSGQSSGPGSKIDPFVVATELTTPIGLTLLPDGSALVGERTTGRIVRVQPKAGQPVPTVRTLTGLDTSGDGGLLDLALSPTYEEDNLIYAYITTPTDNRVVDFTLNGPVTPVFTGIPRGSTGNAGRIAFGADGDLYIATGDAGNPALAASPRSLAGKVLRITSIGRPAPGNPVTTSPIYTSGHADAAGLCASADSSTVIDVQDSAPDQINQLAAGGYYGYPTARAGQQHPIGAMPAAYPTPGGCAIMGGTLWITSLDGQSLLSTPLTGGQLTGNFTEVLTRKYGRLKTVVAAPDGALWLTTSNRDGHGHPVPADERVIRYVPSSSGGGGSASKA